MILCWKGVAGEHAFRDDNLTRVLSVAHESARGSYRVRERILISEPCVRSPSDPVRSCGLSGVVRLRSLSTCTPSDRGSE